MIHSNSIKDINILELDKYSSKSQVVKCLIVEYEKIRKKCNNKINMGAEQSHTPKLSNESKTFVKQQVKNINNMLQKGNAQNNFTSGNVLCNKRQTFNRSQSADMTQKIKKFNLLSQRDRSVDIANNIKKWDTRSMSKNINQTDSKSNLNGNNSSNSKIITKKNIEPIKQLNTTKLHSVKTIQKVYENALSTPYVPKNSKIDHTDNLTRKKNLEERGVNILEPINLNLNDIFEKSNDTHKMDLINDSVSKTNDNTNNNETCDFEDLHLNKLFNIDDFNDCKIEDSIFEVEKAIKEIQEYCNDNDLQYEIKIQNISEKYNSINERDLPMPNNCNSYISEDTNSVTPEEDDFGKRSFGNLNNINFIEAYNKTGNELVVTTVAAIEHKYIEDSLESTSDLENETENEVYLERTKFKRRPNINLEKRSSSDSQLLVKSPISEKYYFSEEELEQLTSNENSEEELTQSEIILENETNQDISKDVEKQQQNKKELCSNTKPKNVIKRETTVYDRFKNPIITKISKINSAHYTTKKQLLLMHNEEDNVLFQDSKRPKSK